MLFISDRLLVGWWWISSAPRGARRGPRAAPGTRRRPGGAGGPRAIPCAPGSARAGVRVLSARASDTWAHLLSVLVTTQTRPDQIEASGASRGNGRAGRESRG